VSDILEGFTKSFKVMKYRFYNKINFPVDMTKLTRLDISGCKMTKHEVNELQNLSSHDSESDDEDLLRNWLFL